MKHLDRRHEPLQTFRGTLYHPTNAEFPIKQQIAKKIAGSGISYWDLQNVIEKFGAKELVGVLSLPPSSTTSKAPRVTKTTRILAKIVEPFKAGFYFSTNFQLARAKKAKRKLLIPPKITYRFSCRVSVETPWMFTLFPPKQRKFTA